MANKQLTVPDIGDFSDVSVIEVYIKEGDIIAIEDPVIALETAKAVTDIPSSLAGKITKVHVRQGDQVSKGSLLADIEVESLKETSVKEKQETPAPTPEVEEKPQAAPQKRESEPKIQKDLVNAQKPGAVFHATPSVRQYARELGVELAQLEGNGPHGRILREDVQALVKRALSQGGPSTPAGFELEDFSVYGEIERMKLSRIQKISGPHLQRSWQTIPLVTQFDQADVTELESFRKSLKEEMAADGVKLSILPFIVKAVTVALNRFPQFNCSYDGSAGELILKKYYHIGIAVDTPDGLVVPVVRDADKKQITELAKELAQLGERARAGKLKSSDISGASFSISSLGGIGGTAFTPIINPPEVAILGVSKIARQPMWNGNEFVPRDVLPLSLSYDHRVIDGAAGARFTTYLASLLGDIRRMMV